MLGELTIRAILLDEGPGGVLEGGDEDVAAKMAVRLVASLNLAGLLSEGRDDGIPVMREAGVDATRTRRSAGD